MAIDDIDSIEIELGFNSDSLRTRYREERDKRLRIDGFEQFVATCDEFASYRDDPYAGPPEERDPMTDLVDVVVIGAGFGGILLGAHMRKQGVESIRFIDRAADFGGVWYWNRYPGAACDIESYIYLPMLEELGYIPSRKYAKAPEIHEHCKRIAKHFDLYQDTCFQTEVTGLEWNDQSAVWILSTNRGDAMRARFVAFAPGPFANPKLAGIPGIGAFKGHSFHTSRWDYKYTGGHNEGELTGLTDKIVGIIGTGATAVQCIPHLAEDAKHLYVFQRTPSSIDFRDDELTDKEWVKSLKPGWQQERMINFTTLISGGHAAENLTDDGWTGVYKNAQFLIKRMQERGGDADDLARINQLANYMKMEELRKRVEEVVEDDKTASALMPWYDHFCKRPCFHDEYLKTFNRENVTLVDTAGKGVDRITEKAIIVGGNEYPIDCLIYSTGFEAGQNFAKQIGFEIVGRDGERLVEKWAAGPITMHGFMTRGFPNFLLQSHVQSGLSLNFPHMIDEQSRHAAYIISRGIKEDMATIEPTQEAENTWVVEVEKAAPQREAFDRECTPSYLNFEGNMKQANVRNAPLGGNPIPFYQMLAKWREQGSMEGLERHYF